VGAFEEANRRGPYGAHIHNRERGMGEFIMPLGKFKGRPIKECDLKYLEWLVDWDELYDETRVQVQGEIDHRAGRGASVVQTQDKHEDVHVEEGPREVLAMHDMSKEQQLLLQFIDEGFTGMLMRGHERALIEPMGEKLRRLVRGDD